ncbi:MAG: hypothetical protein KC731_13085 [Myxococcales bacterium]|nr:hypothetical protein [Myxococcales bacterium]
MSSSRSAMAYAVHTQACTYLLDEDGVCRWIVSQQGVVPAHVRQCIGAQFVASLDLAVEGGLTGELRIGARALFVQHTGENMVLLRTGPVHHIDDRRRAEAPAAAPPSAVSSPSGSQYGKVGGLPYRAKPPAFGVVRRHGEEQTITIQNRGLEAATQRSRHKDLGFVPPSEPFGPPPAVAPPPPEPPAPPRGPWEGQQPLEGQQPPEGQQPLEGQRFAREEPSPWAAPNTAVPPWDD